MRGTNKSVSKIADFALQDGGKAFEARAGVDRRFWQRRDGSRGITVELHEDEVPDFDVAAAIAAEFAVGVALIGRGGAHVVVNFAAWAAGAGVAHGPEILFEAGDGNYAIARRPDLHPQVEGFFVDAENFSGRNLGAAKHSERQLIDGNSKPTSEK